jgi:hypothetical protein
MGRKIFQSELVILVPILAFSGEGSGGEKVVKDPQNLANERKGEIQ